MANDEGEKTLEYKAKNLAYDLHFHSTANYISANRYEVSDQRYTYLTTLCAVLTSASVGSLVSSFVNDTNNIHLKGVVAAVLLITTIASSFLTEIYKSGHSPAAKQSRHKTAAHRLKALCKIVEAWSDAKLNKGVPDADLLSEYQEFVCENSKIEEECIRSEDCTFAQVRANLSPKWKNLGDRLKKFVPKSEAENENL